MGILPTKGEDFSLPESDLRERPRRVRSVMKEMADLRLKDQSAKDKKRGIFRYRAKRQIPNGLPLRHRGIEPDPGDRVFKKYLEKQRGAAQTPGKVPRVFFHMLDQVAKYRFGPFEFHPRTRELYKQGIKLKLRPQPARVLQVLVERRGDVVTREELQEVLWTDGTFVDSEHGINNSVKELRGVLGDSAGEPVYIETLPRLGYRMIVSIEVIEAELPSAAQPVVADAERAGSKTPQRGSWVFAQRGAVLVVSVLLAVATAASLLWWRHNRPLQASGRVMLAVLPFENLTGDPAQDYLSDGLTEEMIAQLGERDPRRVGVIARTSVMHYKNSHEPVDEIGRALHVQYMLEGTVRREGERVRVSVQFVDRGGQTLWSREYDREASHLLTLQGEIGEEVSEEIRHALGGSIASPEIKATEVRSETPEAHDLYLRGTYFLNKRSWEGMRQATEYFQQAVAKDPQYAPAYAAMANSYALWHGYSGELQADLMPRAKEAAVRALELDPNLPEAHVALAVILQNYDWDWETAEKEYRRAIELNPNYATAHHWYAEHLGFRGRFDEAFAESERARQLDPLSLIIASDQGVLLYYSRRYDESIKQFRIVDEMEPKYTRAGMIIHPYMEKGMYNEALECLNRGEQTHEKSGWYWGWRTYIYGRWGKEKEARQAMATLKKMNARQEMDAGIMLVANLGVGDKEQTFFWLEKAYAEHSNMVVSLKVEPMYDPLRGDPRFQAMLRRVRLEQ
jgi:TolB-like protein/DNA-binding winged helix-turn-helix (wHTH) protein/tetratricopeptide (TPR) repeat protein